MLTCRGIVLHWRDVGGCSYSRLFDYEQKQGPQLARIYGKAIAKYAKKRKKVKEELLGPLRHWAWSSFVIQSSRGV